MKYQPEFRPGCRNHYHDTENAYQAGCRCPAAREAQRLYQKRSREGRAIPRVVPSTAARRKIRALVAAGWPLALLGDRLGTGERNVYYFATKSDDTPMYRSTVEQIDALYTELENVPGPSKICVHRARGRGWQPPYAWDFIDDPDAEPVDSAIRLVDQHESINVDEVEFLMLGGLSVEEIATRMGVETSSLQRACYRVGRRNLAHRMQSGVSGRGAA